MSITDSLIFNTFDSAKTIDAAPFNKDVQFEKQNEYRFALGCYFPNITDSLIFCSGIDYMEPCFVNPKISMEHKKELQTIMWALEGSYNELLTFVA